MKRDIEEMAIIAGRAGLYNGEKICNSFKGLLDLYDRRRFDLSRVQVEDFNNGEIFTKILDNIRRKDVYLVHSFRRESVDYLIKVVNECGLDLKDKKVIETSLLGINDDFMELLLIGDAVKRAGANSITLVVPHPPYMREDKKDEGRVPISAKLIFDLINTACGKKLERIVAVDLHASQEQGFSDLPVDNLRVNSIFAMYIQKYFTDNSKFVVVSPDSGGIKSARYLANNLLNTSYAIVDKIRSAHGESEAVHLVGDVDKKIAIIRDDIIDTGGSITDAVRLLKEKGAIDVLVCATHAEFSSKKNLDAKNFHKDIEFAEDKLKNCGAKIVVTDTIPRTREYLNENKDWLSVISLAPYIAEVIYANHHGLSTSKIIESLEKGTFHTKIEDMVL